MQSQPSHLRVRAYVVSVIVLAAVALWFAFEHQPSSITATPVSAVGLLAFAFAGLALELTVHRVRTGSGTASIGFIVFLGSALVFGPA